MTKLQTKAVPCALAALALLGASCQPNAEPLRPPLAPPMVNGVLASPLGSLNKGNAAPRKMLVIRHRLITLQLPLGAASETEQLWGYINEEPTGARLGTCLARNGVRVGIGRESDWPEIARILRRLTGQGLSRTHVIARCGYPVSITVKKDQPTQTIFTFRPDNTLFANDYPPGDNLLVVTAGVNHDDPRAVRISGLPVVRSKYRRPRYVKGVGGYQLKSQPLHYSLDDLAFQFDVPRGGFIMIGPGPQARRPTSPGSRFLVRQIKGQGFETLLVIAPEVFAAPVRVAK